MGAEDPHDKISFGDAVSAICPAEQQRPVPPGGLKVCLRCNVCGKYLVTGNDLSVHKAKWTKKFVTLTADDLAGHASFQNWISRVAYDGQPTLAVVMPFSTTESFPITTDESVTWVMAKLSPADPSFVVIEITGKSNKDIFLKAMLKKKHQGLVEWAEFQGPVVTERVTAANQNGGNAPIIAHMPGTVARQADEGQIARRTGLFGAAHQAQPIVGEVAAVFPREERPFAPPGYLSRNVSYIAVPDAHVAVLTMASTLMSMDALQLQPRVGNRAFDAERVAFILQDEFKKGLAREELAERDHQMRQLNALDLYDGEGMPPSPRSGLQLLQLQWGGCLKTVMETRADRGRHNMSGIGIPSPMDIIETMRILGLDSAEVDEAFRQVTKMSTEEIAQQRAQLDERFGPVPQNE
jgi:hypothetical protein